MHPASLRFPGDCCDEILSDTHQLRRTSLSEVWIIMRRSTNLPPLRLLQYERKMTKTEECFPHFPTAWGKRNVTQTRTCHYSLTWPVSSSVSSVQVFILAFLRWLKWADFFTPPLNCLLMTNQKPVLWLLTNKRPLNCYLMNPRILWMLPQIKVSSLHCVRTLLTQAVTLKLASWATSESGDTSMCCNVEFLPANCDRK